jgi:3-deoxy-manno-octulosonate cytidylyltransferase (CMP-KDO synthetase)
MAPHVLAVIPARLESRRFAGKVLRRYHNKPLLYYVWQDVKRVRAIDRLVIATDSPKVRKVAEGFGAEVLITSKRHRTGSDRVAEVAERVGGQIVLNVQGDNFGLQPRILSRVIRVMKEDRSISIATLASRIDSDRRLLDSSLVKVVMDKDGRALWFSRHPLPYLQHAGRGALVDQFRYYGHVGVYLFRRAALQVFARTPRSSLEKAESLEQLRILEHGGDIRVFTTSMQSVSVDRPKDLKKLDAIYG